MTLTITAGRSAPLGATFDGDGVNFAVFSEHATRITVCLFSDDGEKETARFALPEHDGGIWHGYIAGLRPGQLYALRADGPYEPVHGHRFNEHKLLIDPYARRLTGHPVWHDALLGYATRGFHERPDRRDSAPYMPRCVVEAPGRADRSAPLRTPLSDTVIYEAHAKGMTAARGDVAHPGTYAALASDPVLDHLTNLGITAIELLPVHAFLDDRFLVDKGLTNYWGYQTIGFFAPEPRYMAGSDILEFRHMVDRFHAAGIEVLLDVVYNHTGEGDHRGPTLSFRGLDNASYYRLMPDGRHYINDTGTGNTMNVEHPFVLRLILDSLRYWVEVMGVDGFRFDLCATLGRTATGFDRGAAFFDAVRADPVLAEVKLIAEPWDIGPGGYQLGGFPPPFVEWNDQFRDGVRRFWKGDAGLVPELANRLTGSAMQFDHSGRAATSSVNLVTAHDGFTLADVVSYNQRHNEANGEDGRDGHGTNHSDNMGVEGPTDDPAIRAARAQRRRNLMATLLFSQGTPMILGGDEIGRTQHGNNNAYAQDNEISWMDWDGADGDFLGFTRAMVAFRRAHPILRQTRFLHSRERRLDGIEDLFWWRPDGAAMEDADWDDDAARVLCAEMRTASGTPAYATREDALFLVFNGSDDAVPVTLPDAPGGMVWRWRIDTSATDGQADGRDVAETIPVPAQSVTVCVLEHQA
ncbi:glycogen debranching protein GlgX [Pseudaestuariivita atlantica]|uniref:Glycogen debranching protein n=1 Tax=Pseudaestuariivita atlantica TaxID=1317121 RepID=A0A0L1JL61_9RHOB|nr:glycogen debranching protein GlgX [Pseudaestuariivita atlantica]KNG92163.1 glycogen debranching protein [Pseudaestuariivita atlantica]